MSDEDFLKATVLAAFVAVVFFAGWWTLNTHEYNMKCLDMGGSQYGSSCKLP